MFEKISKNDAELQVEKRSMHFVVEVVALILDGSHVSYKLGSHTTRARIATQAKNDNDELQETK